MPGTVLGAGEQVGIPPISKSLSSVAYILVWNTNDKRVDQYNVRE